MPETPRKLYLISSHNPHTTHELFTFEVVSLLTVVSGRSRPVGESRSLIQDSNHTKQPVASNGARLDDIQKRNAPGYYRREAISKVEVLNVTLVVYLPFLCH